MFSSHFRDRLSASDMLQVRKVIEHVYEKVMGQGSDAGSQTAGGNSTTSEAKSETEKDDDLASIAEEKVELLCNDQVSETLRWERGWGWQTRESE